MVPGYRSVSSGAEFCRKTTKNVFSPRGSVWSFEGGVLLSFSLGLAVRTLWSDLEKCPKSATGQILGRHFGQGRFLCRKMGPRKDAFVKELFCGGALGDST